MTDTEIAIALGTRPEIIKLAPVIRECEKRGVEYTVIHTGQHYSDSLDSAFFEALELPTPEYNLAVGSKSHGEQTGEMLHGIEEILVDVDPEVLLVQGDTNSVLAGALAADKLPVALGHIEAGLRSFDRDMPEESNRRVADHLSDYLFAPTENAASLLREEGIDEDRIFITGNTIVDAVEQHRGVADEKSSILSELTVSPDEYVLMTAHRAENVDDADRFGDILSGAALVAREFDVPVIYPIHPRAAKKMETFELTEPPELTFVDPLDYLDFLKLQENAMLVLTDSGGIQEEASILNVPCVTMRYNTERPETIDAGANKLSGTEPERILHTARQMHIGSREWTTPFGDGKAHRRILTVLNRRLLSEEVVQ